MINISSATKQEIILPNLNKALSLVLKDSTPKELDIISKATDLKSILNTILKKSANDGTLNKELLQLVKNNPTLKSLGDVATTIKDLYALLKNDKDPLPMEKVLKSFLGDIKDLKNSELKQKLENSGVFLESRLKNAKNPQALKEIITNDLKAVLLKNTEEITNSSHPNKTELLKNIDKLLLQIDHQQLLSHLSNNSSLYLPFSWDDLQEGNIEMKKAKDDKFYCDINLKLKEYGELNLKLTLYEENQLNLHIYSSNEDFKQLVKENISALRSALIDTKITPREIRIFELKQEIPSSPYSSHEDDLKMGFEVKV